MARAVQVARAASSGRLRPSCCPTMAVTAVPRPHIGTQATLLTVKASVVAARGTSPSRPTSMRKTVKAATSMKVCNPPGPP